MLETPSESDFQLQRSEQRLKNDDAGIRSEPAIFGEPYVRNLVDFGVNFGFTGFHLRWLSLLSFLFLWKTQNTQQIRASAMF